MTGGSAAIFELGFGLGAAAADDTGAAGMAGSVVAFATEAALPPVKLMGMAVGGLTEAETLAAAADTLCEADDPMGNENGIIGLTGAAVLPAVLMLDMDQLGMENDTEPGG